MGWINIFDPKYDRPGTWLHFFIGGRGKGKTYGGLKGAWEDAQKGYGHGFILLRRTDKERKLNEAFNPFVKFNRKSGYNAVTAPLTKDATGIYNGVSGDFWGSQEGCQGPFRPSGRNRGTSLETPWRARASSWNDWGTTWFFSSCGGIFELPQGIHASSCVGPQKSYLPFEIRGRAGGAL